TWKMVVDGVELSKRIEGDDGPGDRALERGRVLASATDSLSLRAPESGPVPQTSQPYAAFS
ncbi:MAG TPA: hypothetical protein VN878_01960, partial [Usitatibacter sp.]|nr:hypothetical protein [Usitatibacter sp.]